jgi:anti-sigma-K factor RskA
MTKPKAIWKSKTFWFNVLAFVAAVAGLFGYTGELPADLGQFVLPAVFLINLALRYFTKQPVSLTGS